MDGNNRKAWWQESRFGMFIHWGIYSLMGKGEWVMYFNRIPISEYEKLAGEFNPTQFNPEQWVRLAKDTGMKYIVFTAKHHDGFSMFKTNVSKYNIIDSTPYGKDVITELAEACKKQDIQLCFYYTHVREWHHPHAQSLEAKDPYLYGNYGNFWDYPDENGKNLQKYIDDFDKPQLNELLTQYGPIGIIWFDTPSLIRPDQAQELIDLVREIQPNCLVNSRVGDSVDFDYHSLGDDQVPEFNTGVDFETPMTICHAWGYNNQPNNRYREVKELIHQLVDIVSLGGNYLLNVGPDPNGVIPPEAQERLDGIGEWMRVNGEAIHGTNASPFPAKPSWGKITSKEDTLYLHIYQWSDTITLTGIKSDVKSIELLAAPGRELPWEQEHCGRMGYDRLTVRLPRTAPDLNVNVMKVRFENPLMVESSIIEDDTGCIQLPASLSAVHSVSGEPLASVNITGVVQRWVSTDDWFSWDFLCEHPGEYSVALTATSNFNALWDFGHQVAVECGGQVNRLQIADDGSPSIGYQKRTFSAGIIRIDAAGQHSISIRAQELTREYGQGFTLSMVRLMPRMPHRAYTSAVLR